MHILILADTIDNQNAGVHHYLKNLIKNLLSIDKSNKYSFIHCKENKFFKGKNHYIIPSKKIPGSESYRKFFKIPKLIKKLNPDIVFETSHIGPFNLPKHIKKAVTIYDLTPILYPAFHIKRSTIMHKLLLGKAVKNADLILAISNTTKSDMVKRYNPNAHIRVTPLGVTSSKSTTPSPIPQKYILYLGTIEPRKNLETLIDAFVELKNENKIPHKLILAGAVGWKSKEILQKAKHKDIILPGYLSKKDKATYYKHADMFVYPSIYEGFGLPPLEAMSHAVPVICSTGGSLKEIFEKHTLTFEPKDKETLKAHILNIHNNPQLKKELGKKGLEYSKNFTWEKTAKETLKAFEQIMN